MPSFIKRAPGYISAIFVGALGSALWQASGPFLGDLLNAFVRLSSFGLSGARDGIYQEIAAGGGQVFMTITLAFECAITIAIVIETVDFVLILNKDEKTSFRRKIQNWAIEHHLRYIIVITMIFLSSFLTVEFATYAYVVAAEANIKQLIDIDKQFISEREVNGLASRAASMKNRNDYVKLIKDLKQIAIENKIDPPDFSLI